jgi:hypothetical protein
MSTTADLALLLHDPDSGRRLVGRDVLSTALGGAQLTDLVLACRAVLEDGWTRVRAVDRSPADDPVLEAALALLPDSATARQAVRRLARGAIDRAMEQLVAAGRVVERRTRVLGLVPVVSHPVRDRAHRAALLVRVKAVLYEGAEPTEREATLVALLDSVRVLSRLVDGSRKDRKELHRRACEVAGDGRAESPDTPPRGAVMVAQAVRLAVIAALAPPVSTSTPSTG